MTPYAAASAALWVAGSALAVLLAPIEARTAVAAGALAAGLGGAVALVALAQGLKKGTKGLLAGFSIGFGARMLLVAAGLLASGAQGRVALLYAASFFALYAATQAVEIAFVWRSARAVDGART